jgi:hypothetical protein
MRNSSPDEFERILITSLKVDCLNGLTSDDEFLKKLNTSLLTIQQTQTSSPFSRIWFNGIFNGLAAVAVGVILLVSLHVLPPFLFNASISGTRLIQAKIVATSVDQSILWQRIAVDIKNLK